MNFLPDSPGFGRSKRHLHSPAPTPRARQRAEAGIGAKLGGPWASELGSIAVIDIGKFRALSDPSGIRNYYS